MSSSSQSVSLGTCSIFLGVRTLLRWTWQLSSSDESERSRVESRDSRRLSFAQYAERGWSV